MREEIERENTEEREDFPSSSEQGNLDRRSVLQGALFAAGSTPVNFESLTRPSVDRTQPGTESAQTLEIIATEDADVYYRFTIAGNVDKIQTSETVEAGENDKMITGQDDSTWTVRGFTGNRGYGDAYEVEGEFQSFERTDGTSDFDLLLDGREVEPEALGGPDARFVSPTRTVVQRSVEGTLEVISTEEADLYYDFSVKGEVTRTETGDTIGAGYNDAIITRADEETRTVRGFTGNPGYGDAYQIDGSFKVFRKTGGSSDFFLRFDGEPLTLDELARLNVEPASDCVHDQFETYSQNRPSHYTELLSNLEERARNAELNWWVSQATIGASRALKVITRLHYGDFMSGADEFLQLMDQSARLLSEESEHPLFRWLREYTGTARFVHGLLYDSESTIEGYIGLVQEATELQHEADVESIGAALALAYKGHSGSISDDVQLMAVDVGEVPLDSAITGLKVNAQQQLLMKTFAESQLPLLEELARLTKHRTERELTEQEMNEHFACRQAYWLAHHRFARQIHQLQRIGMEESIFFELANIVREQLGELLDDPSFGADLLEASKRAADEAERTYNRVLNEMVTFREDVDAC